MMVRNCVPRSPVRIKGPADRLYDPHCIAGTALLFTVSDVIVIAMRLSRLAVKKQSNDVMVARRSASLYACSVVEGVWPKVMMITAIRPREAIRAVGSNAANCPNCSMSPERKIC
jgi:hypothetical protein